MIEINFSKKLFEWDKKDNKRSMPWKGESDPYRIWLSEIILQQTRVEQGLDYYNRFISQYPDVFALANAPEKDVFKSWEGLGYYNRCRNLITTAKKIANDYNGIFPSTYHEILNLPGIGAYTAAAISSFAFGMPYAVVDGNVERVLSRYFGVSAPVGSATGKKFYNTLAMSVLDKKNPGLYNQALMDFGATVCKPRNPLCENCVQAKNCQAFLHQWTELLPVKTRQPIRKTRWLNYFIIHDIQGVWIRERIKNDIWKNLYEFVLWESGQIMPQKMIEVYGLAGKIFGEKNFHLLHISPIFSQTLTHQTIRGRFFHLKLVKPAERPLGYFSVPFKGLTQYPFPKLISDYIKLLASSG
jgi:A/G-specific adenine glycosylase